MNTLSFTIRIAALAACLATQITAPAGSSMPGMRRALQTLERSDPQVMESAAISDDQ
ncbi:hypothetical protein RHIZO_05073 [Rhizobiaceae bacterium]|nr:hypothetical protein RHIZO_05073 [Rhizobiaceae bacterium]